MKEAKKPSKSVLFCSDKLFLIKNTQKGSAIKIETHKFFTKIQQ